MPNIDNGMVTYDPSGNGVLHTVDWRTYMAGIQYYLPPAGRLFTSANYTHGESRNIVDLVGGATLPDGTANPRAKTVIKDSSYLNTNLFFDVTPSLRTAVSFNYAAQHYGDGEPVRNLRWVASAYYFF